MKSNNDLLRAAHIPGRKDRAMAIAAFIWLAVSLGGLLFIGWGA